MGVEVSDDYLLQTLIYDRLSLLIWFQTEDGAKGVNRPVSFYETLTSHLQKKENEGGFDSSEEFEKKRKELLTSIKKGGIDIG